MLFIMETEIDTIGLRAYFKIIFWVRKTIKKKTLSISTLWNTAPVKLPSTYCLFFKQVLNTLPNTRTKVASTAHRTGHLSSASSNAASIANLLYKQGT